MITNATRKLRTSKEVKMPIGIFMTSPGEDIYHIFRMLRFKEQKNIRSYFFQF